MKISSKPTIVAPVTTVTASAVAIVRISGSNAKKIGETISGKKLQHQQAIPSKLICNGTALDFGLVLFFATPHSLTGEDIVEFQCHGSVPVIQQIIAECCRLGARLARAGEFLERAFLNNKIDLTQAEAIAGIISSKTAEQAKACFNSLTGAYSEVLLSFRDEIIKLRVHLESVIDFSEDDFSPAVAQKLLTNSLINCKELLDKTKAGISIHKNRRLLLLGKPNVGKSSLFNYLSEQQRAIVTDIAGTTRDLLFVDLSINSLPFELVDTAGLNENTTDVIEQIGVAQAKEQTKEADIILWVLSDEQDYETAYITAYEAVPEAYQQNIIFIANKCDKTGKPAQASIITHNNNKHQFIRISLLEGKGIENIKKSIGTILKSNITDSEFSANYRHMDALETIHQQLLRANDILALQLDIAAEEVRLALQQLDEIVGKYHTEDLLGDIFSKFCIGK